MWRRSFSVGRQTESTAKQPERATAERRTSSSPSPDAEDEATFDRDLVHRACPWVNGFAASFHSRLCDEFLATEVFETPIAVRKLTAALREDYSHDRPHGSLGYVTPVEFTARSTASAPDVGFGYASASISATAVQRTYPNPHLHNTWYRNLELIRVAAVGREKVMVAQWLHP